MLKNVSRRQFLEAAGAVAAGVALVGCSSDEDTTEETSDDTEEESDDTTEEESTASTGDILIGIMGPYTGDVSQYGINTRNGAMLYLDAYNEAGGVNGKTVNYEYEDEKGDATEAVTVYNKLVEDGVTGIIGDVTSTPSIAVAQISVEDNMPMVTPSGTGDAITTYGSNFFRACVTDSYQGVALAQFCQSEGITSVATLYNSESDYEVGINETFVANAADYGITITSENGYPADTKDFSAYITTIIADGAEAILAPNYYEEVGLQVTAARAAGFTGAIMGADGWDGVQNGYADAEDLENTYYTSAYFNVDSTEDEVVSFVSDYEAAYDDTPNLFSALGYDAAMILVAGLEGAEAQGLEPGSDDYKQAIIDTISTCEVEGLTGTITFSGTGDPSKGLTVFTFVDGVTEQYMVVG